jgi:hypothetical protein
MVCKNHGGLPTAAILGPCPLPYTFVTGDLNFPSKIWSKSVVHSADPSEDTLKRCITTVPFSITTTHHPWPTTTLHSSLYLLNVRGEI